MWRRSILLSLMGVTLSLACLYVYGDKLKFKYILWKVNRTHEGGEIIDLTEDLKSIGGKVLPELMDEYGSRKGSFRTRYMVGLVLLKEDEKAAENLFRVELEKSQGELLAATIANLTILRDQSSFLQITRHSTSTSVEVRRAVVDYLASLCNDKTHEMLKIISSRDDDVIIRKKARLAYETCEKKEPIRSETKKNGISP